MPTTTAPCASSRWARNDPPAVSGAVVATKTRFRATDPTGAGRKPGKLVVLLDVVVDPNGNLVRTGLEDFLAEWNVQVGNTQTLQETLTNSGGSTATITQTNVPSGFTLTGISEPMTLAAGQSASFSVKFSPQSGGPPA